MLQKQDPGEYKADFRALESQGTSLLLSFGLFSPSLQVVSGDQRKLHEVLHVSQPFGSQNAAPAGQRLYNRQTCS